MNPTLRPISRPCTEAARRSPKKAATTRSPRAVPSRSECRRGDELTQLSPREIRKNGPTSSTNAKRAQPRALCEPTGLQCPPVPGHGQQGPPHRRSDPRPRDADRRKSLPARSLIKKYGRPQITQQARRNANPTRHFMLAKSPVLLPTVVANYTWVCFTPVRLSPAPRLIGDLRILVRFDSGDAQRSYALSGNDDRHARPRAS